MQYTPYSLILWFSYQWIIEKCAFSYNLLITESKVWSYWVSFYLISMGVSVHMYGVDYMVGWR